MSECCDTYGDCRQSDTCPHRTGKVLPHKARHACKVAKIKSTRPIWMDGKGVPPEAGNFQIVDLGPDDDDGQPLTHKENMALLRTLLSVVAVVAALVFLVSVGTEQFSKVLWALLQGVS